MDERVGEEFSEGLVARQSAVSIHVVCYSPFVVGEFESILNFLNTQKKFFNFLFSEFFQTHVQDSKGLSFL